MDSHKKTFDSNDIRDLIDSYVRETKSRENDDETTFTDENTERVLFELFLAGSETTSTTLYWAFLYMILKPDIQTKVQSNAPVFGDNDEQSHQKAQRTVQSL